MNNYYSLKKVFKYSFVKNDVHANKTIFTVIRIVVDKCLSKLSVSFQINVLFKLLLFWANKIKKLPNYKTHQKYEDLDIPNSFLRE